MPCLRNISHVSAKKLVLCGTFVFWKILNGRNLCTISDLSFLNVQAGIMSTQTTLLAEQQSIVPIFLLEQLHHISSSYDFLVWFCLSFFGRNLNETRMGQ